MVHFDTLLMISLTIAWIHSLRYYVKSPTTNVAWGAWINSLRLWFSDSLFKNICLVVAAAGKNGFQSVLIRRAACCMKAMWMQKATNISRKIKKYGAITCFRMIPYRFWVRCSLLHFLPHGDMWLLPSSAFMAFLTEAVLEAIPATRPSAPSSSAGGE